MASLLINPEEFSEIHLFQPSAGPDSLDGMPVNPCTLERKYWELLQDEGVAVYIVRHELPLKNGESYGCRACGCNTECIDDGE